MALTTARRSAATGARNATKVHAFLRTRGDRGNVRAAGDDMFGKRKVGLHHRLRRIVHSQDRSWRTFPCAVLSAPRDASGGCFATLFCCGIAASPRIRLSRTVACCGRSSDTTGIGLPPNRLGTFTTNIRPRMRHSSANLAW
jgi:hypothetical protein